MNNPIAPQNEIVIERQVVDVQAYAIRQIGQVEDVKHEIKLKREMLNDTLINDPDYSQAKEAVRLANQELKAARARARGRNSNIMQLEMDIKDLGREKKETQLGLFTTLETYQAQTGRNTIEMPDGDELLLKKKYELKRKK